MSTVYNDLSLTSGAGSYSSSTSSMDDPGSADRFLKLLVTQMQNQDPLNPLDNAQVTSQLAQINTVNGIEKLNTSVQGLSSQFGQMQALQGVSLIGRDVVIEGNQLAIADGVGKGGFELSSPADSVSVEVLAASGQVIETINLGAQSAGLHSFDWPSGSANNGSGLSFRVTATSGGIKSTPTTLMRSSVEAVSNSGNSLQLELGNGKTVSYGDVKAFS